MRTTDIGRLGEELAAKFLKKNGYTILEQNKHQSHNEIDIIASNKEYIVFVEVKTRSVIDCDMNMSYGTPASAVTRGKQMRTVSAARAYLAQNADKKHTGKQPRMDVIEIYLQKETNKLLKINHIEDAFGASR